VAGGRARALRSRRRRETPRRRHGRASATQGPQARRSGGGGESTRAPQSTREGKTASTSRARERHTGTKEATTSACRLSIRSLIREECQEGTNEDSPTGGRRRRPPADDSDNKAGAGRSEEGVLDQAGPAPPAGGRPPPRSKHARGGPRDSEGSRGKALAQHCPKAVDRTASSERFSRGSVCCDRGYSYCGDKGRDPFDWRRPLHPQLRFASGQQYSDVAQSQTTQSDELQIRSTAWQLASRIGPWWASPQCHKSGV